MQLHIYADLQVLLKVMIPFLSLHPSNVQKEAGRGGGEPNFQHFLQCKQAFGSDQNQGELEYRSTGDATSVRDLTAAVF